MAKPRSKEFKSSGSRKQITTLPEMASAPEHYYQALENIQFDNLSLYFFYHSPFRQRFAVVCSAIDNQFVVRFQPGFEANTTTQELKDAKAFYTDSKQQEAEQFFSVDAPLNPDSVNFSVAVTNAPGVVHQQLIDRIELIEHDLFAKFKTCLPIGTSFYKYFQDDETIAVIWTNRSGWNKDAFHFDDLAIACFAFDDQREYAKEDPYRQNKDRYDLHYHLTRSIPFLFYTKMIYALNEKLKNDIRIQAKYPKIAFDHDFCYNEGCEEKWHKIRALYNEDRGKAIEKIQHLLIRNLYLHYLSYGATGVNFDATKKVLLAGLKKAEEYGIPINFDYIPPEFNTKMNIEQIAQNKIHYSHQDDLRDYITQYKARQRKNLALHQTFKIFETKNEIKTEGLTRWQILILENLAKSYDLHELHNFHIDRMIGPNGQTYLDRVCTIIFKASSAQNAQLIELGNKALHYLIYMSESNSNLAINIAHIAKKNPIANEILKILKSQNLGLGI